MIEDKLVKRLNELSDAVTKGRDAISREFEMRVPAEPERDADLVLSTAAITITTKQKKIEKLEKEIEIWKDWNKTNKKLTAYKDLLVKVKAIECWDNNYIEYYAKITKAIQDFEKVPETPKNN